MQNQNFPPVQPGSIPSNKRKKECSISDKAVIFACWNDWYAQEPGEPDWKRVQNFPFPDGADNICVDRVGCLPFDYNSKVISRIQ